MISRASTFKTLPAEALSVHALCGCVALAEFLREKLVPKGMYWCPQCNGSGTELNGRCLFCGGCGSLKIDACGASVAGIALDIP